MTNPVQDAARALDSVQTEIKLLLASKYRHLIREAAPTVASCTWDVEPEYDDAGGTFLSVYCVRLVFSCGTAMPLPSFSDLDCGEWSYFDHSEHDLDLDTTSSASEGALPSNLVAYERFLVDRGLLIKDLDALCQNLVSLYYLAYKPSDHEMTLTEDRNQQPHRTQAVDDALQVVNQLLLSLPLREAAASAD